MNSCMGLSMMDSLLHSSGKSLVGSSFLSVNGDTPQIKAIEGITTFGITNWHVKYHQILADHAISILTST